MGIWPVGKKFSVSNLSSSPKILKKPDSLFSTKLKHIHQNKKKKEKRAEAIHPT
jgi:hypothetical protein